MGVLRMHVWSRRVGRMLSTAALVVAAILVTGCGSGGSTSAATATGTAASTASVGEPIKVGFQLDFLYAGYQAPFFLALDKGYWKDAGLDVTIRQGNGSANGIKTLLGGLNQVGFFDRPTMAVSADHTSDLLSVMGIDNKGGWCVATPVSEGITTPQGLEGKTIATQLGGADGTLLPAFLQANGIDGKVTVQSVDPAAKTTLLQAGKVDGSTYINYAQVPQVEASGTKLNTMLWSENGLHVIGAGIITTKSWAEKQPEALKAFVAGTVKAFQESQANPSEAIDAFMRHNPKFDRKVATEQLRLVLDALSTPDTAGKPVGYQAPEDWQSTIQTLTKVGMIKNASPMDQYYTNSYLPTGG